MPYNRNDLETNRRLSNSDTPPPMPSQWRSGMGESPCVVQHGNGTFTYDNGNGASCWDASSRDYPTYDMPVEGN